MHIVSTCLQSKDISHFSVQDIQDITNQVDGCLDLLEDLSYATMFERGLVIVNQPTQSYLRDSVELIVDKAIKFYQ